jgi:hypothetical protein
MKGDTAEGMHHESIIRTAIATHANATYGDSRSPTRTKNVARSVVPGGSEREGQRDRRTHRFVQT